MNDRISNSSGDFFESAYRERPPWDIGAPQPALLAVLDEFTPTSPALDVGCGTGALAFALAERGLNVLGIDLVEAAIAQARAKAVELAPEIQQRVEFRVADALHPSLLGDSFGTVVDSGFFHIFGAPERQAFVEELGGALVNGGRYYLLGFAIESPFPNSPRVVTESELRELFRTENGWNILTLRPAQFVTRSPRGDIPAIAACVERVSLT